MPLWIGAIVLASTLAPLTDARAASSAAVRAAILPLLGSENISETPRPTVAFYEERCKGGSAGACARLAEILERGIDAPRDLARAAGLYRAACERDVQWACAQLGLMYLTGSGVPADAARAQALLARGCADKGAEDCRAIGSVYRNGMIGTPRDPARALAAYDASCRAGRAVACADAGAMYERGEGAARDLTRAAALYGRGCHGKVPRACVDLGRLYLTAEGVEQDPRHAAALFKRACEDGEHDGCVRLGSLHESGWGVTKDARRAAALYERACDGGEHDGCVELGSLYEAGSGVEKDVRRAIALYQTACDHGSSSGCISLGALHENGLEVPKDLQRAAVLYRRACDDESARGCYALGCLYRSGFGGPRLVAEAGPLLRRSCDYGMSEGCGLLEAWRFAELRLVAMTRSGDDRVAHFMERRNDRLEARSGQRLLDGVIRDVSAESVEFVSDDGRRETRALFGVEPPTVGVDPQYRGTRVSLNVETDASTLVVLLAELSGTDAVVADGSDRRVRAVFRDAAWDEALARTLAPAGLGTAFANGALIAAPLERMARIQMPRHPSTSSSPISLSFRRADVADLARIFADISGLTVRLPKASCGPVGASVREVPWDEALRWITAACGWTYRIDGGAIEVESLATDRPPTAAPTASR